MRLLCGVGLSCLFPRKSFAVLQRKNWTGSDEAVDQLGLPTGFFRILPSAYGRAMVAVRGANAFNPPAGLERIEAAERPSVVDGNIYAQDDAE